MTEFYDEVDAENRSSFDEFKDLLEDAKNSDEMIPDTFDREFDEEQR